MSVSNSAWRKKKIPCFSTGLKLSDYAIPKDGR